MIRIDTTHQYGKYKGKLGFVFLLSSEEETKLQKGCSQYELHLLKRMGEREMGFNIFLVYKLYNTRVWKTQVCTYKELEFPKLKFYVI